MPTQQCESRKNYIGLVTDDNEEQRVVESMATSDRRMQNYLLGLMAAMFSRRGGQPRL